MLFENRLLYVNVAVNFSMEIWTLELGVGEKFIIDWKLIYIMMCT